MQLIGNWTMKLSSPSLALVLLVSVQCLTTSFGSNLDTFNYRDTKGNDYGPKDWRKVQCPDVNSCAGYTDTFPNSLGWKITSKNHCMWCPASGNNCGTHHSSPIDLDRNVALQGDKKYNECIDKHWMAYFDSSCSYDELRSKNAFSIERYALKITQPINLKSKKSNGLYAIDCTRKSDGKRVWGGIDFSKGFSEFWYLSHINFHVPSEHTQEGKQYSGEIEMYHFYSIDSKVNNEMGSVSIFLDDRNDQEWGRLNTIICAWREAEEKNRAACGIPSVTVSYSGCPSYNRKRQRRSLRSERNMFENSTIDHEDAFEELLPPVPTPALSAFDILLENNHHQSIGNTSYKPKRIDVYHDDEEISRRKEFDWESFLNEQRLAEELQPIDSRNLQRQDKGKWFNYFPMPAVKTEYYFRYSGTMTTPPCYGEFISGNENRKQTNHWRVMKDPINVSKRQITEMHRLLRDRISPANDPRGKCRSDTAAKVSNGRVDVARPVQETDHTHFQVFCECDDWNSKFSEDQEWCKQSKNDRFFKEPYNFNRNGF